MIIIKIQERFYHSIFSKPCTVVVINEYHFWFIITGVKERCRCKQKECFDDMNQSKTDTFEIIATYINIVTKDRELVITVPLWTCICVFFVDCGFIIY